MIAPRPSRRVRNLPGDTGARTPRQRDRPPRLPAWKRKLARRLNTPPRPRSALSAYLADRQAAHIERVTGVRNLPANASAPLPEYVKHRHTIVLAPAVAGLSVTVGATVAVIAGAAPDSAAGVPLLLVLLLAYLTATHTDDGLGNAIGTKTAIGEASVLTVTATVLPALFPSVTLLITAATILQTANHGKKGHQRLRSAAITLAALGLAAITITIGRPAIPTTILACIVAASYLCWEVLEWNVNMIFLDKTNHWRTYGLIQSAAAKQLRRNIRDSEVQPPNFILSVINGATWKFDTTVQRDERLSRFTPVADPYQGMHTLDVLEGRVEPDQGLGQSA